MKDSKTIVNRVSTVTIGGNIVLSILKAFAGIVAHSSAMISDDIHSASDVFSTVVVMIGIKLASKKADKEQQQMLLQNIMMLTLLKFLQIWQLLHLLYVLVEHIKTM